MMNDKRNTRRKTVKELIKRCNGEISVIEANTDVSISLARIKIIIDANTSYFEGLGIVFTDSEKTYIEYELLQRIVKVAEQNKSTSLEGERVKRWLTVNPPEWNFWNDYEDLLLSEKKSREVIWDNEKVIDDCLDLAGDPNREGPWESRGLVMGNVQSGKTLNFIGLINKAVDAGYHTIIVIGGHLKELREQTQERIDEGVLGRDSRKFGRGKGNKIIVDSEPFGVANSENGLAGRPHHGTTYHTDFTAPQARALGLNYSSREPVVFVVKKNYKLLNNLKDWIEGWPDSSVRDRPMMLIDDEADYASINTKKAGEKVAATNTAIKGLLKTFTRKTYIGYTATPFANVFIPQYVGNDEKFDDDLFPRDFMASMPIPDSYCGQDYFFPQDSNSESVGPVRNIEEKEYHSWLNLKHKKDVEVEGIPESLEDAILCFLLVIAIRYRGGYETAHNTMLVNVSRFNDVQWAVSEEIDSFLSSIKNAVRANGAWEIERALEHSLLQRLYDVYNREYSDCGFVFADLLDTLNLVCKKTKVSLVNGLYKKFAKDKKLSPLPYSDNKDEGLWVIAVGGLKLSRGLTLEGLSISYFLRNAAAYDTLTQMCRWYGYRPGYKDLCRLWITEESETHYYTVANAIRQLYQDLRLMKASDGKPKDFGLRVRASDLALLVTARNKMGSAELVTLTYNLWGNDFRKLRSFSDDEKNAKNHTIIGGVIARLEQKRDYPLEKKTEKPYVIKGVEYEDVIEIVKDTEYPMFNPRANPEPVIKALRAMSKSGIDKPTIILFNVGKSTHPKRKLLSSEDLAIATEDFNFEGFRIGLRNRTMTLRDGQIFSKKGVIGDSDDLAILFGDNDFLDEKKKNPSISDYALHQAAITSPVLIIYIFSALISKNNGNGEEIVELGHRQLPTINYSLIFPRKETVQEALGAGASIPEMEKEESYYQNEVLRGIDLDNEIDEDEEILDDEEDQY
jgi:hypothetical protein